MAFGLGVTPLVLSTGAGAAGRNAIGSGVLGGTIAATVLGVLLVPLFFVAIRRMTGKGDPDPRTKDQDPPGPAAEGTPPAPAGEEK
jgi:HAE1 family hydrophobic/amphiphilic exporter-1/multidrug efflux pump